MPQHLTLEEPALGLNQSSPPPILLVLKSMEQSPQTSYSDSWFLEMGECMNSPVPQETVGPGHQWCLHRRKNLHLILALQATDGSVFAVETILQVYLGLPNEVI